MQIYAGGPCKLSRTYEHFTYALHTPTTFSSPKYFTECTIVALSSIMPLQYVSEAPPEGDLSNLLVDYEHQGFFKSA